MNMLQTQFVFCDKQLTVKYTGFGDASFQNLAYIERMRLHVYNRFKDYDKLWQCVRNVQNPLNSEMKRIKSITM